MTTKTPYEDAYTEFLNSGLRYAMLKRTELRAVEDVVACINAYAENHHLHLRAIHRIDRVYFENMAWTLDTKETPMTFKYIQPVTSFPTATHRKNSVYRNEIEALLNHPTNNLATVTYCTTHEAGIALLSFHYFIRRYHYPLIVFRRGRHVHLLKMSEKKEIDTEVKVTGGFS